MLSSTAQHILDAVNGGPLPDGLVGCSISRNNYGRGFSCTIWWEDLSPQCACAHSETPLTAAEDALTEMRARQSRTAAERDIAAAEFGRMFGEAA